MGSIQNELNDFLQKPTGNHISANEISSLAELSLYTCRIKSACLALKACSLSG